jgi:hypothetical protein
MQQNKNKEDGEIANPENQHQTSHLALTIKHRFHVTVRQAYLTMTTSELADQKCEQEL